MTADQLTNLLARRVMGWTVGPDRFMMGNRGWMPRWRFQPAEKLEDAFRLLESATATYTIAGDGSGTVTTHVCVAGVAGTAYHRSIAASITIALARAIGIEVPDCVIDRGAN